MKDDRQRLHFRGSPLALSAVVRDAASAAERAPMAVRSEGLSLPAQPVPAAFVAEGGDAGIMRLHLPRSTPPGTYEAQVSIGGEERAALIEVEPDEYLRIVPDRLLLAGAPGEAVTGRVTLFNLGNVEIEVPKESELGLYERGGLSRAFGDTMRQPQDDRTPLLESLLQRVRDTHAGLLRLEIAEGSGGLAPGESRELALALHLPRDIRGGRAYSGLWALSHVRYPIEINCSEKKGTPS